MIFSPEWLGMVPVKVANRTRDSLSLSCSQQALASP